ncbi:unnamed protein product [Diamesa serratosioi]
MGKNKKNKGSIPGPIKDTFNKEAFKRKAKDISESLPKRKKIDSDDENNYPGKYVLLQKPINKSQNSNKITKSKNGESKKVAPTYSSSLSDEEISNDSVNRTLTDKPIKNGKKMNGTSNNMLAEMFENMMDSDDDDYEDMDTEEEGSFESELTDSSEDSMDYDYCSSGSSIDSDECSFRESDCESVTSDENDKNEWTDGTEDDDYVPDIEDLYIKKGDSIMHSGKGLDAAFGSSKKSQIIEINDIALADNDDSNDSCPDLIGLNGEKITPIEVIKETKVMPEKFVINDVIVAEETTEEQIFTPQDDDDEEEMILNVSELSKYATCYNCVDGQGVVMKFSKTIYFNGILLIKPLLNNVQVNGYRLDSKETITANSISRADYFLNLTPVIEIYIQEQQELQKVSDELEKMLLESEAKSIVKSFNFKTDVLLLLEAGFVNAAVAMLRDFSSQSVLPNKKFLLKDSTFPICELTLATKFFTESENKRFSTFKLNDQWDQIELNHATKAVVIGGKNVGKSGLTQYLINKNINKFGKILLIDLDIGQPICAFSQTVSATVISKPIIGPGYLSNNYPDKCLLYGDKSIMISPFKYVRCIRELLCYCNSMEEYKNIPWIVNTMGYQKGFGMQLMCLLLRIIQPTDVIQIQHQINGFNFAKIITEKLVQGFTFNIFMEEDLKGISKDCYFTTHVLDSIVNNFDKDVTNSVWISNATEKRKLSLLAQLSKLLKGDQTISLNNVVPLCAQLKKLRILVLDEQYSSKLPSCDLLNGNLIYLCHTSDSSANELDTNTIAECFGVGIVRGIDHFNEEIYMLLPQHDFPKSALQKINVLAVCNVSLPAEVLLKQNFNIEGTIPFVSKFESKVHSTKYVNKKSIKDLF